MQCLAKAVLILEIGGGVLFPADGPGGRNLPFVIGGWPPLTSQTLDG
jgi:hypothetical protein